MASAHGMVPASLYVDPQGKRELEENNTHSQVKLMIKLEKQTRRRNLIILSDKILGPRLRQITVSFSS